MKRLFKKGERVKNRRDGKVMEVLKYIKDKSSYLVECAWFDLEKKEIRTYKLKQDKLLKAS
ncbi:hypothetical protein C900_01546 [Fulvivirga imtechensis AK7]|uniref:DUF2158 domain-containing protein n=1 Tax=Fulvivirga imtechensis AK7 TaxID=1237149 RepID=L8JW84_9BACT|nr:hypothetical protein [Fulvivirga imtechensis]ELR72463.1 hypothetical protein C900_01546 [Fulvivirga imtechensis AK7]